MRRAPSLTIVLGVVGSIALGPSSSAGSGTTRQQKKVKRLVAQGDKLLAERELVKALEVFQRADKAAAGASFEAHMGLARTKIAAVRYRDASQHGSNAAEVATTPHDKGEALELVARTYFDSMFFARVMLEEEDAVVAEEQSLMRAEEYFRQAITTSPEGVSEAYYYLGRVLQDQERFEEAQFAYREYLVLEPGGDRIDEVTARVEWLEVPESEQPLVLPGLSEEELARRMTPPRIVHSPQPLYTPAARRNWVQGLVIVQVVIDRLGSVTEPVLIKGLPDGLDLATLAAIRAWRFEPALLPDGTPAAVFYTLTVNFQLGR